MAASHDLVEVGQDVSTTNHQRSLHVRARPQLYTFQPPARQFQTMTSRQEVLHAYRHLYKGLLRGVQYAIPARYIVRDQIRGAFRSATNTTTWDAEAIKRTLWFLSAAGRQSGLEHKILRNLVRMHSERAAPTRRWRKALVWNKKPTDERERYEHAFQHYDATVAMLNKSMGLCLR